MIGANRYIQITLISLPPTKKDLPNTSEIPKAGFISPLVYGPTAYKVIKYTLKTDKELVSGSPGLSDK